MTDDHDDHDDDDHDQDTADEWQPDPDPDREPVDVDVDEDLDRTITLYIGEDDDDLAYYIAWASLFTGKKTDSEAVWEALRRWVWAQTDFEGDVAADAVPPTEEAETRYLHRTAALDRVNPTRLRTMSDLAIAKEIGVYGDYYNRRVGDGDGAYRRVDYHLSQAQKTLEDYYDHIVTQADSSDTPDTE